MRTVYTITLSFLLSVFTAQADLLNNGDFQTPGGTTPAIGLVNGGTNGNLTPIGGWDVFNNIPGWTGGTWGVEVQGDGDVASGGNQWAELDTNGYNLTENQSPYFGYNSSMQQDYTAASSGVYKITFDYKIRTDRALWFDHDNMEGGVSTFAIGVFVDGADQGVIDDPSASTWTMKMSNTFSLSAGEATTIKFVALGWADSFGGLLDNISIQQVSGSQVPEPGTFVLVGLGLVGAYFIRRRRTA